MDFIVYSYGGAEILWKILNSLAMLANSSYFYKLSTLMTAGALLVVAARAIPAASIPFLFKKWILPTFFLMAFFWGPKVTVDLVDHVDTNFKASSVANVPFGVAFAASLSTRMSDALTAVVEKYMTTSDMQRYSQVGPMFGARLMYEARTLTIRDPIMRENLKDFTRQCYAWPYVFTNIAPGKKAAMESEDMLGFIEANAHKSLGMYWRKSTGETQFMFCKECAAMVKQVIPLEVEMGFQSLAKRLFGGTEDGVSETARLKQYFGDAWQFLAKGSSDAANVIQQELMLNAYRAALQDKREEFGLGRNPALSYLNAERGQIQQDESSLVKFALFGTQIPMLHSIFMAIALMFFVIVAPFTFTTGGIHLIKTFAKVMLWLAIWPPLSSILNVLGHMYLAKASAGQLMGYGEGLNLMTQSGLADTAYHAYTFVMGLQLSIPAVSWALLSGGGGYAMSQLSSNLTQPSESFAAKAGSEMVDGNVSFDSQTVHHKSVANTSLAQQQLSPNINSGSKIDDGTMATTYGAMKDSGDRIETHQQHLTNMGTTLTQNDAVSSVYALEARKAYSAGVSNSKSAAHQAQLGMNELYSFMEGVANAKGINQSFGNSKKSDAQSAFREAMDKTKEISKAHNISEEAVLSAGIGLAANTNPADFKSGKIGGMGASLSGNYQVSARDSETLSKLEKNGVLENLAKTVTSAFSYLEDDKVSIGDTATKQKQSQIQHHHNESKNFADQAAVNYQDADYYTKSASMQRQKGVSSSSNITDQALASYADERGVDVHYAAQEASKNPEILKAASSRQIDLSEVGMRPNGSGQEIKNKYKILEESMENPPPSNAAIAEGRAAIKKESAIISNNVDDKKNKTKEMGEFFQLVSGVGTGLKTDGNMKEQEYKDKRDKAKTKRLVGID